MRRSSGFTLIELMIVVVIVAILSMIAYPSYRDHLIRGYRANAQQFMLDIAQRQEQFFLDQRQYTATWGAGGINLSMPDGVNGKYTNPPTIVVNNAATPPTYQITLVPIAGTLMANDGQLIIDNLGRRWREIDANGTLGGNDCSWEDSRCKPS